MSAQTQPDFIIEAVGLSKNFGGFMAVDNIDLRVRRGDIHALIGPNGAGKTTVFNLLTKFETPSSGKLLFNGKDITAARPADVASHGMVRSFQISAIFPRLTARENLRVALLRPLGISMHFWRSPRRIPAQEQRVLELLAMVGLAEVADTVAASLPYGRRRALEIATTLALDPQMLLLDEPMSGLGAEDVQRISELVRQVAANRTVLMVEHNLAVVANLSSTITVLTRGRVLAEGPYAAVSQNPAVVEAYIGVADD